METIVGAILTQNTNWKNVERAIQNLRSADALTFDALDLISNDDLAELIRPSGFLNVKTVRLKSFVQFLGEQYNGSLDQLFALDLPELRAELLSVKGIGPETADCIVLYAAQKPSFVVDAYTRRFMQRHGWCAPKISYDHLAARFTDRLEPDTQLYNEYHALIVQLGKEYCKAKPVCAGCPLERFL